MKRLKLTIVLILSVIVLNAQNKSAENMLSWEVLQQHEVPEWFQDAKFGIYAHLGVYCVPAYHSEWYPRYMYSKGHPVQKHHEEKYGKISEFGYHDFIPMFKLENFDAKEWAELFYMSGAKFAGTVAEHHDGFSMWDSKVNRWNAKDMGPKRDIIGELTKEIRGNGMKVITSFHHAFNVEGYYPTLEGTATADPEYADLYGKLPAQEMYDRWLEKLKEVIDNYSPDQIWFDWGLRAIPMEYRRRFASYYYQKAKEKGQEVIITRKLNQLPVGVGVLDLEGGGKSDVTPFLWQTDQSTGGPIWSWREGIELKTANYIIHELIRATSKNGVLLLNVCPSADGTINDEQKQSLMKVGDWLYTNGEAIYGTRPWRVSGEGPQMYGHYGYYMNYTSAPTKNTTNVSYTQKDGNLYAICLEWPENNITFDKIIVNDKDDNAKISLLGYGDVKYSVDNGSLTIDTKLVDRNALKHNDAYVFKISGFDLEADPFSKIERLLLTADNATIIGEPYFRKGNKKADGTMERNSIAGFDNKEEKIQWLVNVKVPGEYIVRGEFATRFNSAKLCLSNGEDKVIFNTIPSNVYGEGIMNECGSIHFDKTGVYKMELSTLSGDDFRGVQRIWQIELAPVD